MKIVEMGQNLFAGRRKITFLLNYYNNHNISHCFWQSWLGMLIFENFISRYENFKSWDSSSTWKLTRHSEMVPTRAQATSRCLYVSTV